MRGSSELLSQAFLQTLVVHLILTSSFPVTHQQSLNLSRMSPSPALSPDISPLFPTPSRSKPTEPSLPIISSVAELEQFGSGGEYKIYIEEFVVVDIKILEFGYNVYH